MMAYLAQSLKVAWEMACQAGIYVIFGLVAAGLVHLFVSRQWLARHLGGRGFGGVVRAAVLGAPLPLCSCSVLPAAYALRSKGASRGATVSFLISTPETGIDSIAVTWALMGPVMALVRPAAAILTGMVAGFFETIRDRHEPPGAVAEPACVLCNSDSCEHVPQENRLRRFWRFVIYEMGDDIGPTLTLGLILAGVVTILLPDGFFEAYLGSPWISMFVMLAVGLPLYVCATASTPLAAALMLKGLNPGAALVFLLVGPATNMATIMTVGRMLGKASAVLYVGTIAVAALLCGAVLDLTTRSMSVSLRPDGPREFLPDWLCGVGAVLLAAYLGHAVVRWAYRHIARNRSGLCGEAFDGPGFDAVATPGGRCDSSDQTCSKGH